MHLPQRGQIGGGIATACEAGSLGYLVRPTMAMGHGTTQGEVALRLPQLLHQQKARFLQERSTQPQDRTQDVCRQVARRIELLEIGGNTAEYAEGRHALFRRPGREEEARIAKPQRSQQELSGPAAEEWILDSENLTFHETDIGTAKHQRKTAVSDVRVPQAL